MNKETIQGKWTEIKGELQKAWGRITDDEWEQTKGDATAISGLIQQRYGENQENVSRKVKDVFERYVSHPAKDFLKNKDSRSDENLPH